MSSKTKTTAPKEEAKPALVPKLRFPEFRETEGWGERPLSEFMSESRLPGSKGNVAKKITVKLWGNGVFEKNEAIQGSINTQYFRRNAGQFIYSKLDFLNQAFGIIPPSLDGFESTVDLPCFDFADGLIPAFLLEYVKRRDFYERLGETADGSRKARRIHAETFLSFPIALPSTAEQQKIAECLSSVDELMAAQARKVDALKTHKKGLMQQLFPREGETQPRLRFPEFQNAGEWEMKTMGSIASFSSGGTPSKDNPAYWNGTIPWVSASSMYDLVVEKADHYVTHIAIGNGTRIAKKGSILILVRGSMLFKRVPICVAGIDVAFNQDVKALDVDTSINTGFLLYHLSAFQSRFPINETGIGAGKIELDHLKGFELFIPDAPEQQRIATCLSSLDALITAETQKHEALKTHKNGLMQQLFPSPEEVEA
jgi:type I restriction enzyme S subunit